MVTLPPKVCIVEAHNIQARFFITIDVSLVHPNDNYYIIFGGTRYGNGQKNYWIPGKDGREVLTKLNTYPTAAYKRTKLHHKE
jgi:hypothetical protein